MTWTSIDNSRHALHLSAPIDRWDEAIPLGNGVIGALIWGGGNTVHISLDRADLWDTRRPAPFEKPEWNWETMKNLIAKRDRARLIELFERPNKSFPYPSKIPAGRIDLIFADDTVSESFSLKLREAVAEVRMANCQMRVFCSAVDPVGVIDIQGATPELAIRPPAFEQETSIKDDWGSTGSLGRLGYQAARHGQSENIVWTVQHCGDCLQYAIVAGVRKTASGSQIAFTVATNKDNSDPCDEGRRLVADAMNWGYEEMCRHHMDWWENFWSQSAISIPDLKIEQHYHLVQYFYGAASRRGAPPIPLQGVWTADEGTLPPWKGDYHHDLNTQLTYWPYLAANHLDEGLCLLDFLWELLPQFQNFAHQFYAKAGACIPSVMSIDGKAMGGWHPFAYSPTNGIWVAHAFYRHWRYTMDKRFLTKRAYPFCKEIAVFIESLLEPGPHGKLQLPLSSSPELHDNNLEAWCTPNTNYDLALMRWLFGALVEMAGALQDTPAAEQWGSLLSRLDNLAVSDVGCEGDAKLGSGGLMISPDEQLSQSHRHMSHLMAIYPLGLLDVDRSQQERSIIHESIRWLDHLGMQAWCGYSFCWAACIAARGGQSARALNMLELYLKAFVSRNGFHLNGDFKGLGLTAAQNRPFTLEGNFAFAEAVHEMMVRCCNGIIRLFPALPQEWKNVEVRDLRTDGAFRVSARRKGQKTVWIRICAEIETTLHLYDPFDSAVVHWNRQDIERDAEAYCLRMLPGEILEGDVSGLLPRN